MGQRRPDKKVFGEKGQVLMPLCPVYLTRSAKESGYLVKGTKPEEKKKHTTRE